MPSFAYTARDDRGAAVNGVFAAASAAEVSAMLRQSGKYPVSVRPAEANAPTTKRAGASGAGGIKISRQEVIQLSTQIAIMLETGVTLSDALGCLAQQNNKPAMQQLVDELAASVDQGTDFSTALAKHPRSFPKLYVALVRASEKSGMMPKLIGRATAYMRDEQETRRKVKGAMTYPGIMLGFAITTTLFLLAFVLPRFTKIYAAKGASLPTPTKILMAMSDFVTGHYVVLALGIVGSTVGYFLYRRTPTGRRTLDWAQLNVPLIGPVFRKVHLSRGLRMVGTMAGSGVNLVDSVQTAQDLCENVYYTELWDEVLKQISAGKQMSEPLASSPLVPKSIAYMLQSGEKSGKLSFVMEQISAFSEAELKETISDLTRYIEPAMIVIMGVIIGGVSLALMLPIFTISKVVAH